MNRAAVFAGPGLAMEIVRFGTPEPRGSEIVVRVECCTLCRSDLHTHAGRRTEPTPIVLGHEIVGWIEKFGPEAKRKDAANNPAEVGSRISWAIGASCGQCCFCTDGIPQKCEAAFKYGHQRFDPNAPVSGGLSEFVTLRPGTYWLQVPDNLSSPVAALANCATATAAAVVRSSGRIAGRTVLILGGGVLGLMATAMTRCAGAHAVIVSDPDAACRARAIVFGATHVFSADREELTAGVGDVTHGRGVHCALELAGTSSAVQATIALTRIGGTVVLAGTVAPVGTIAFDPELTVRRMLTIRGMHNYHPNDLDTALQFLAGPGREFPWSELVVAEFPLEDVEQAFTFAHARPGVRVAVMPGVKK